MVQYYALEFLLLKRKICDIHHQGKYKYLIDKLKWHKSPFLSYSIHPLPVIIKIIKVLCSGSTNVSIKPVFELEWKEENKFVDFSIFS